MAIDIFAIGLILYELRFGEYFFKTYRDDFHQLAVMHVLIEPMSEKMAREGRLKAPHLFKVLNDDKIVLRPRAVMDDDEFTYFLNLRRTRNVSLSLFCDTLPETDPLHLMTISSTEQIQG